MGRGEKRQGPMGLRLATRKQLMNCSANIAYGSPRECKKRGSLTSKNVLERGNGQGQVNHDRKSRQRPHGPAEGFGSHRVTRANDAFSTQRAKSEQCFKLL